MYETRRRRKSTFDMIKDLMEDFEILSEELGEAAFFEGPSWDTKSCCIEPLCNVLVTEDEVVVTADLPYTDPDTIKVEITGPNRLEIKAEMKRRIRFDEFGITHRQGEFQFFRCINRIPVPVDSKRMKTSFKKGILEVRLPRKKARQ